MVQYKYVHIKSQHRRKDERTSRFSVSIPHGLQNVSRVSVKDFVIPNTFHNVYGDYKELYFIEFYKPSANTDWTSKVFKIVLDEGYSLTADIISTINTKLGDATQVLALDGTTGHQFATEASLSVTVTHNSTTYFNSFLVNSGTVNKLFCPYVENPNDNTLWENLGFLKSKILEESTALDVLNYLNNNYSTFTNGTDTINSDTDITKYYARYGYVSTDNTT